MALTKTGAGTLSFTGDGSGFTDTLMVAAGRFDLDLGSTLGGSMVVEDAGTIGGEGTVTGDLQLGSILGTGAILAIDPATSTALSVANLTLEGPTRVAFDSTPAPGTTIPLVSYSGTLTNNSGLPLDEAFDIPGRKAVTDNAQTIEVTVGAPQINTWTGAVSGFWEVGGADANWSNSADSFFMDGDTVIFDDSAPGIVQISDLDGDIPQPASVSFTNTLGNDYTIAGDPIGGMGGLTVGGTGTVILEGQNTYTGGTVVNDGVLESLRDCRCRQRGWRGPGGGHRERPRGAAPEFHELPGLAGRREGQHPQRP